MRARKQDALPAFLAIWVLLPFLFFSLSQSKLPGYILPSVVPCGLLVAVYLRRLLDEPPTAPPSPLLIVLHALLSGALLAVALVAPYKLYRMPIPGAVLKIAVPLALIVAFSVAIVVFARGYAALRIATVLPLAISLAFILRAGAPVIDATQSTRPVVSRIAGSYASQEPILFFDVPRQVEYGFAFYLDRPLPEPPPDEVVKFGAAAEGTQPREKTLKDITNTLPPSHGNYVVVLRTGDVERFAAKVPPNYQIEPFFRFQPQRLDIYHLRDVGEGH